MRGICNCGRGKGYVIYIVEYIKEGRKIFYVFSVIEEFLSIDYVLEEN